MFNREDALGWLVIIERYYLINGIEGDEHMELVLVALEGLNWFYAWEEQVYCHMEAIQGGGPEEILAWLC